MSPKKIRRPLRPAALVAIGWLLLACVESSTPPANASDPLPEAVPPAVVAPQLLFTDILSGPNKGGEDNLGCYLSLFGRGLGLERGDSTVRIGGKEVAAYRYWGAAQYANGAGDSIPGRLGLQQITVQLGPEVDSGAIEVHVDGRPAQGEHAFTVRPGKIFFVEAGAGGDGKVGKIDRPFHGLDRTFHLDDFKPGDFIVLRGGRYVGDGKNGRWLYIRKAKGASAEDPFTVHGYPGELVLFDGVTEGDIGSQAIVYTMDKMPPRAGYVFANMKIKSNRDSVIRLGGRGSGPEVGVQNHVRLVNLDLHAGATGRAGTIGVRRADHLSFFGIYIHDNFVEGPGLGSKYAHQLYFSDGSRDVDVGWVELARFDGGTTISVRKSREGEPFIVHEEFDLHDMIIHDQTSGPIVFGRSAGKKMRFYNNRVYRVGKHLGLKEKAVNGNAGLYLKADRDESGDGTKSAMDVEIYHNVFYDCGNANLPGGCLQLSDALSVRLKNNIVVVKTEPPHARMLAGSLKRISSLDASHNLWWHPGGVKYWNSNERAGSAPEWLIGETDIVKAPAFVDPDAELPDFRLRRSSPARGAGSSIEGYELDAAGVKREGAAVAIGALEAP